MSKNKSIIIAVCVIAVVAVMAYQLYGTRDGKTLETEPDETSELPETTVEPSRINVTDCLNRTVTIAGPIEKMMFIGRGNVLTLSVAYLFESAPDKIHGVTETFAASQLFRAVDPGIDEKMLEGVSDMGVEEIAANEPDVVVLKSYLKVDVGDPLESLGINVVYLDLEDLDTYSRDVITLGGLMGEEERAEEIVAYYRDTYNEVKASHDGSDEPSVFFLYYSTKGGSVSFMSPGADWLQTDVIDVAGGAPLSNELAGTGWNTVNFEQIAEWNPEIVFIVTYKDNPSCEEVKQTLMSDELWQGINAVQEGRLYAVPDDCFGVATVGSWDTSGSRWILCLQWMEAKINWGDDAQLLDTVQRFYVDLYGLSEAEAQALIEAIEGDL